MRAATARFHRVEEAVAAGYELGWVNGSGVRIVAGCVAHPTAGAMGYHYFNADLMEDNAVRALQPEVLVYAPAADGGLKLVAVEWVARSAQSNPPGVSQAPRSSGWTCTSWSHRPVRPSTSPTPGCGPTTRQGCSRTGTPRSAASPQP